MTADTAELTPEHSGTEPQACPAAKEKRWSALLALLTAWLLPATTARRTAHVSLRDAYVVHWLAAVLAVFLVFLLIGWTIHLDRSDDGRSEGVIVETTVLVVNVVREFKRDPGTSFLVTASLVLSVELTFLGLAILLTPWGARDEPIRASVANALRRVWLQTSHVLPAFALIAVFANTVIAANRQWERNHDFEGSRHSFTPQEPVGAPVGSQAWQDYEAALKQYEEEAQAWEAWWRSRPWYVEYGEQAIGMVVLAVATWFLWALFRAVGAPRVVPPVPRPPTCEFCGYNLTAAPMDARCPECGEPVERSLGPDARPGPAWQRTGGLARVAALWRCSVDAIRRPSAFGRQIQLSAGATSHRWLVAILAPLVFIVTMIGVIACFLLDQHAAFIDERIITQVMLFTAPIMGYFGALALLGVMLATAWLVALYYRLSDQRNLLHAATQIAAYLGGYVVLWALISGLAGAAGFAFDDWFRRRALVLGIDRELLTLVAWFLPNLTCLTGYVYLVRRGTGAARYANR
ncbi:MAG: hypothetical protein JXA69_10835 [Phycisphaerae bacterium]|nr:hypothetical protein [Phycisphaerae bacterium]